MRNVIVTGGTRGLGLAIAKRLVLEGFRVIAAARNESIGLREAIASAPEAALHFAPLDLSDVNQIPAFAAAVKKAYGAPYGLVNNAALGTAGMLGVMHNSQIEQLLRVNVAAPIVLTKYVARQMVAAGRGGRIVNMASIIASTGCNGLSVYGASKAAMVGFTRSLARELGPQGVTVNAVAPGFVDTEMTAGMKEGDQAKLAGRAALRRFAAPEDVAQAVAYLFDDRTRNVTGSVLTVDAGATA